MKNVFYISLIFLISSCSFFNDKEVYLPIKSRPSGASVYVDGQYFGETPTSIKLEPSKNYRATIVKKGYGTSNIDLETWYSVRGGRGSDNARCVMDALGTMLIIPALGFYSVHCRDFKQTEYIVDIGRNNFSATNSNLNLEVIDRGGYSQDYSGAGNSYDNNLYQENYRQNNGQYGGYNQDYSGYGESYGGQQR